MDAMFNQPIGRLERRRQFEARRWKKTEMFSEYYHMVILGNRILVAEDEMVDYVIEGIPSEELRNQARMHSFETNINEGISKYPIDNIGSGNASPGTCRCTLSPRWRLLKWTRQVLR